MNSTTGRTDIESGAVVMLGGLPESDQIAVLRECSGGSEQSLGDAITTSVRRQLQGTRADGISAPAGVNTPGLEQNWKAAVEDAALKEHETGSSPPTLDEVLPQLVSEVSMTAQEAEREGGALKKEVASLDHALEDSRERRDLQLGSSENPATLRVEQQRWRKLWYGLVGLETCVVLAAVAAYFGVFDAPSIFYVPLHVWAQVLAVGLPASLASFVLALGVTYLVRRMAPNHLLRRAGVAVVVTAIILFAVALGVLRWAASFSAMELSDGAASLGSYALFVLVAIASLAVAAGAVYAHLKATALGERILEIEKTALVHQREISRLTARRDPLQQRLEGLLAQTRVPASLRSYFEQCVKLVVKRLREEDAVIQERVARAQEVYRYIMQLSGPVRELLLSNYLFRLERIENTDDRSDKARLRQGSSNLKRGANALLLFIIAGLSTLPFMGCPNPQKANNFLLACDGTGPQPALVCSKELLAESFAAWAVLNVVSPGSTFQVITSGGSFAATRIQSPLVVPSQWSGNARRARVDWIRQGISALDSVAIPNDQDNNAARNQSDLISLLLLATRQAAENPQATTELLLASDGLFISQGFSCERDIPQASEVLSRLKQQGIAWDLSGFSKITLCGAHNVGVNAQAAFARDKLWRELISAGQGPTPQILTSCQHLFPPLHPKLLASAKLVTARQ